MNLKTYLSTGKHYFSQMSSNKSNVPYINDGLNKKKDLRKILTAS